MKSIAGTPAEVEAARAAISTARGYPKRGRVYRRDLSTGELVHVTGDRRYDVVTVVQAFAPEVLLSEDGNTACIDVDTDPGQKIPPEVAAFLKAEADLPAEIKAVKEKRRKPPPELDAPAKTKLVR
jgi:hypothetical protein